MANLMTTQASRQAAPQEIERRVLKIEFEERAADDSSRKVVGYAAVFNSDSEGLGWFIEQISPGAFKNAIGKSDARALFNHDDNLILARQSAGTLLLQEDEKGLRFEFDMPETTYGNDLLISMQKKNVRECSFAFTVKVSRWVWATERGELDRRYIDEVDEIYDVSLVTYPAYPATEAALRSKADAKKTPPNTKSMRQILLLMMQNANN